MAHSLTTGMLAATTAPVCRPVLFCEIDTNAGNAYFWSGFGNVLWGGQTWIGAGNAMNIGAVTEQTKVEAAGCAIALSGVNIATVSLVLNDIERYLPAKVWLGAFDDNQKIINTPYLILNGRVDTAAIVQTGKTATITVTAEGRLIAMRFPRWRRYTDLDQRLEHPTDGGFSFVDTIQDATINFHG